jgi:protein TonB
MQKVSFLIITYLLFSINATAKKSSSVFAETAHRDSIPATKTVMLDTTGKSIITDGDKVFEIVEFEASFPGGTKGWINFLQENLNGDVAARKRAPVGQYTVIVQFIVNKKGKVSEIKTLTSHGHGMEKEVIRVMKKSPDWLPAMQNGKPVNAYRKQPVTFIVSAR